MLLKDKKIYKMKINIGILGCSKIAEKYAIDAFKKIKNIDKIFIASRDANKAKKWAKDFGILSKNSYDEVIKDPKIDAIYMPLPIKLHEEWAIKCAKEKKHVICEKSLSYDLDSVRRIVNKFNKEKLVLFENFMCDYHPQHQKIKSCIKDGEIGKPLIFKSYFGFKIPKGDIRFEDNLLTGCFNDMGAYIVFMSRKIFEEEPVSVVGDFNQKQGIIYVEFPSNKKAFGAFGFENAYQNNYSIWGTKGIIETERAYSIAPKSETIISLVRTDGNKDLHKQIKIKKCNQFELIFKNFCKTVVDNDSQKRLEKYNEIISQAIAMQALRLSNELNKKIFLRGS